MCHGYRTCSRSALDGTWIGLVGSIASHAPAAYDTCNLLGSTAHDPEPTLSRSKVPCPQLFTASPSIPNLPDGQSYIQRCRCCVPRVPTRLPCPALLACCSRCACCSCSLVLGLASAGCPPSQEISSAFFCPVIHSYSQKRHLTLPTLLLHTPVPHHSTHGCFPQTTPTPTAATGSHRTQPDAQLIEQSPKSRSRWTVYAKDQTQPSLAQLRPHIPHLATR